MSRHTTFIEPDDEPIGEALLKPWGWLGALVVLAVVGVGQVRDAKDHASDWPQSSELTQAQRNQQEGLRRQEAAQAMCASDFGPQVLAVWVDDTTVECVNPHGHGLSTTTLVIEHAQR